MSNFNFNKVILGGRLTADPELKSTPDGVYVTTFTVAVSRRGKDQPADFINVTAWRQTEEFVTRNFRKASGICIVGSIQTRSWTDPQGQKRYATEVVADEVFFVDSKSEAQKTDPTQPVASNQTTGYIPEQYAQYMPDEGDPF
jgi:single-strand DNA-binding protein